jgi:hypothetical protein
LLQLVTGCRSDSHHTTLWSFLLEIVQKTVGIFRPLNPHFPNISTTPLRQWVFWQCLPFSWKTLRGKHCRDHIAIMGVVDTFGYLHELWLQEECSSLAQPRGIFYKTLALQQLGLSSGIWFRSIKHFQKN